METVIPKAWAWLLEELNLENCRITQNEDSHIKKGNGSMFAFDIACERWKSFKVYTPDYFDKYEVEKVWYDKRLWDYVVVRHGEFRFVYWHTFTELKVWDRLWKNQIVWDVTKSWMSTWMHLHIELWKRDSNIKWKHLYWKDIESSKKSDELRIQRDWISDKEINQEILDFIWSFEWKHLKAYWDFRQWSIWYGTLSYKWEVITPEEADKRWRKLIQSIRNRYNLQDYSIDTQKAVVSFVYNIWRLNQKQVNLLKNEYYRALWNDFLQYNKITIDWEKVLAWWLVKRRQAEFNLLVK